MTDLEQLVDTLLWEGHALYPYTPGTTKNATPTPFGIVYPPVYAAGSPTTFERIRLQGVVEAGETLAASVRFLEETAERRVDLPATPLDQTAETTFAFERVRGRVAMSAQMFFDGITRVTIDVENLTDVPDGLDRTSALRYSLLSTHVIATIAGGRFFSPGSSTSCMRARSKVCGEPAA